MKVMCIDNSIRNRTPMGLCAPLLRVRKVYTVVSIHDAHDGPAYTLEEIEHPLGGGWYADRFIPLPNHDETETEVYKNLQVQTV